MKLTINICLIRQNVRMSNAMEIFKTFNKKWY